MLTDVGGVSGRKVKKGFVAVAGKLVDFVGVVRGVEVFAEGIGKGGGGDDDMIGLTRAGDTIRGWGRPTGWWRGWDEEGGVFAVGKLCVIDEEGAGFAFGEGVGDPETHKGGAETGIGGIQDVGQGRLADGEA